LIAVTNDEIRTNSFLWWQIPNAVHFFVLIEHVLPAIRLLMNRGRYHGKCSVENGVVTIPSIAG
jgi:hypothetical protein